MSIGVWDPKKPASVQLEKLRHLLAVYRRIDAGNLATSLTDEEIQTDAVLMKLDQNAWQAAEQLGDEEIADLIRFFTLAEMQIPAWDGGDTSPVIYLARILRSRDAFTPDLRRWIKAHSDNRYLPYGRAL